MSAQLAGAAPRLGDGRDRMLKDQLLLGAGFQNQRELVEALDATQQLRAIDEVDGYGELLAAREIEKSILDILRCCLCVH